MSSWVVLLSLTKDVLGARSVPNDGACCNNMPNMSCGPHVHGMQPNACALAAKPCSVVKGW